MALAWPCLLAGVPMPPSCGRSGFTRNGEGVQSVILGLVEDEDDFSIPITQSKQSTGKMWKKLLLVEEVSTSKSGCTLFLLWTWAFFSGKKQESPTLKREKNNYRNNYRNMFFHFFPMFSYRNMFFPYVFLCFFWSFLGSINRNATWLGSVWKNLVVPPQQISWPGRVAGWFHLKYAKFAEVYEVYSFQKFGNIQVYYFLDFQVGLCKVSSMLGFSYLNWRYLPHIRPI